MSKSQGRWEEERKKFMEQVPGQLMALLFGKTAAGSYVPIAVDEEGKVIISGGGGGGGRLPTITVAAADSSEEDKNIADFVADGVDDQETINTAIEALPESGGRLVLLEGTFHLTGSILIDSKSRIHLMGMKSVLKYENPGTNVKMLHIKSSGSIFITNLIFDGNYSSHGLNMNGIYIEGSNRVGVKNCEFYNIPSYAIFAYSGRNVYVESNYAESCFRLFYAEHGVTGEVIFANNRVYNTYDGLIFSYVPGTVIVGNYAKNTVEGHVILLSGDRSVVVGNMIDTAGWDGIAISGASGVIIAGNTVKDTYTNIDVDDRSSYVSIFGNSVSGGSSFSISVGGSGSVLSNNAITNAPQGALVGSGITVTGNAFSNIEGVALQTSTGASNVFIKNNIFMDVGTSGTNGVVINGDSRNPVNNVFFFDNILYYTGSQYDYAISAGPYANAVWIYRNFMYRGASGGIYNGNPSSIVEDDNQVV